MSYKFEGRTGWGEGGWPRYMNDSLHCLFPLLAKKTLQVVMIYRVGVLLLSIEIQQRIILNTSVAC